MNRFQHTLSALISGTVLLTAAFAAAAPQQDVPPVPPVIHSETNLVLIDTVVTEKGAPIHGLDKSKFHLFEDGKEQTITSFEEHRPGTEPPPASEPLPAHVFSNKPQYPPAATVNVLLLDSLNMPIQDQARSRVQMIEYLGTIPAGTPMAIFTLGSQLRLVQGFTSDPATLLTAIKGARANSSQSPILENGLTAEETNAALTGLDSVGGTAMASSAIKQFEQDVQATRTDARVKTTLDSLNQLARYLGGIPGRKNLIWFSGSFPISLDPEKLQGVALPDSPAAAGQASLQGGSFSTMADYSSDIRKTSVLLTTSRVSVYPVDARGLMNGSSVDASNHGNVTPVGVNGIANADQSVLSNTIQDHTAMEELATETGGRAFTNTNDFKQAVAGAIDHGGSYYTITYTPASKHTDETYHKLKLKVDGGPYSVAYRHGYFTNDRSKGTKGKDTIPQSSLMLEATKRGAPPATQILFQSRILPADDPEIVAGPKLVSEQTGELTKSLKGPTRRYVVDSLLDAHDFAYTVALDGTRQDQVEMTLVGYDADGKRLNYVDRGLALNFTPDLYAKRLQTGIPLRMAIDLPSGPVFLRIAVRDVNGSKVGSLEVPLPTAK